MKIKILNGFRCSLPWAVALLMSLISCQEKKWDEYYSNPASQKVAGVLETIGANPNYSEFVSLLKKAGADSLLEATGQYTVLAVKNGMLGSIDINNKAQVKKIIDMHVLPVAIYKSKMTKYKTTTMLGKNETFDNGFVWIGVGIGSESIPIVLTDNKVSNGVIHEVGKYIIPYDNLVDALAGNSDYSIFYNYVMSTRTKLLDLKQSIIIGYDSIARPVYDSIFSYRYSFFDQANIGDESTVYTIFIPKNDLVNRVLSTDINVPWGGLFPYSSFFNNFVKDRLFKSCIVPGVYKIADLQDVNRLRSTSGAMLKITKTQIGLSDQKVSNGIFHVLTSIDLPDYVVQVPVVCDGYVAYPTKPSKALVPDEMPLINFTNGNAKLSQQITNKYNTWFAYHYFYYSTAIPPVLQYRVNVRINGTSSFWYPYNYINPGVTTVAALTGSAIVFTLPAKYSAMTASTATYSTNTYRIDFVGSPDVSKATINTFSALPRGWYNVVLNSLDSDNSGVFDISYGSTLLLKDFNASNPLRNRTSTRQNISLGPIYNPAYGKIPLTFTLRNAGINKLFQLELDAILFTAVPEP
jgi:uncharacterized surface protein with fasciclin (FAS1) repeats